MSVRLSQSPGPGELVVLPSPLTVGTQLIFHGRIPPKSQRFSISLETAYNHEVFLFNPRLSEAVVVRTSKDELGWQAEERHGSTFPFTAGLKFTIRMWVEADHFLVHVNGERFTQYRHRMHVEEIHHIRLKDGAEFYQVSLQRPCRTPYRAGIPGTMRVETDYLLAGDTARGRAVRLRGVPTTVYRERMQWNTMTKWMFKDFYVTLTGERAKNNVIGLHTAVGMGKQTVAFNTWRDGKFQREECHKTDFPFRAGKLFDMFLVATDKEFVITVDKHTYSYTHRVPMEELEFVSVCGAVNLVDVQLLSPMPPDFFKRIPSGMDENDVITIIGFLTTADDRFDLKLLRGQDKNSGNALSFWLSVRDDQLMVSGYSQQTFPLTGKLPVMAPFDMDLVATESQIAIFVGGVKIGEAKLACSLTEIRAIQGPETGVLFEAVLAKGWDTRLHRLPRPLCLEASISFSGVPKPNSNSFMIACQTGEFEDSDVVFCLNVSFTQNSTLLNTREGDVWGSAQIVKREFPFQTDKKFEIVVFCKKDSFKIIVDGENYADFVSDVELATVSYVSMMGDCLFLEPIFHY
ncbi:uncharacterized protein LOC101859875 [Aplysia californica]|uniref:Uncharacterized protein LOC101859875 n=1 Tax=Aplysia californica TaxID=6500 RepID=A0ABM1A4T2_APLCA|nr:uncharacterized protein LOC101859875 [Aplysia californica]